MQGHRSLRNRQRWCQLWGGLWRQCLQISNSVWQHHVGSWWQHHVGSWWQTSSAQRKPDRQLIHTWLNVLLTDHDFYLNLEWNFWLLPVFWNLGPRVKPMGHQTKVQTPKSCSPPHLLTYLPKTYLKYEALMGSNDSWLI